MKKRMLVCFLLCLTLCLSLAAVAGAQGNEMTLGYVTDAASLFTEAELTALNDAATRVSSEYHCVVYAILVDDYTQYNPQGVEECAQGFYSYYDLGYGDDRDGLLLLLSLEDRDYALQDYGPNAANWFTDSKLSRLESSFLKYFREDDWYGGVMAYIEGAGQLLARSRQESQNTQNGQYGQYHESTLGLGDGMDPLTKLIIAIAPSSAIALAVCQGFKSQMKTAKERDTADEYVVSGSARLRIKEDQFINRTRTVQVIEQPRDHGGGHGGSFGGGAPNHSHSGKF